MQDRFRKNLPLLLILALDGPLQGQALRAVPYIPAFASAWQDFYPDSRWYDRD